MVPLLGVQSKGIGPKSLRALNGSNISSVHCMFSPPTPSNQTFPRRGLGFPLPVTFSLLATLQTLLYNGSVCRNNQPSSPYSVPINLGISNHYRPPSKPGSPVERNHHGTLQPNRTKWGQKSYRRKNLSPARSYSSLPFSILRGLSIAPLRLPHRPSAGSESSLPRPPSDHAGRHPRRRSHQPGSRNASSTAPWNRPAAGQRCPRHYGVGYPRRPSRLHPPYRRIPPRIPRSPVAVYVSPPRRSCRLGRNIHRLPPPTSPLWPPGPNIGASHPPSPGPGRNCPKTLADKVTNDAAAFIRSIARGTRPQCR